MSLLLAWTPPGVRGTVGTRVVSRQPDRRVVRNVVIPRGYPLPRAQPLRVLTGGGAGSHSLP
eukprot:1228671-Heterocapsa_arctica.AAC.1